MKRKRHNVDEILAKLRQADMELGKGKKVPDACKAIGDSTRIPESPTGATRFRK